MGGTYSTQDKTFTNKLNSDIAEICNSDNPDYDGTASIYTTSVFAGLHNVYLGDTPSNSMVYIPKSTTVEQFCTIASLGNRQLFEVRETRLFVYAMILFGLAAIPYGIILSPFSMKSRNFLYFMDLLPLRLALITIGILILVRTSNPKTTIPLSSITSSISPFAQVSQVSRQVRDGTFAPPTGLLRARVPGTTSTDAVSTQKSEYLVIKPNTALPLHSHVKSVYAVSVSGDLEYFIGSKWIKWNVGAILSVPAGVSHSVRAGADGGSLMTYTDDSVSPLDSMKV